MLGQKTARLVLGLLTAVAALTMGLSAQAQDKKIKIGVVYDLTGPLAGGGSELHYIGAKIAFLQQRAGPLAFHMAAYLALLMLCKLRFPSSHAHVEQV